MSIQESPKVPAKGQRSSKPTSTREAAGYAFEMLAGLRQVIGPCKELRFLDYLLAASEEEARQLSARQYH